MHIMEEISETAKAYHANLPKKQKRLATKFFKSMDTNGDGKNTLLRKGLLVFNALIVPVIPMTFVAIVIVTRKLIITKMLCFLILLHCYISKEPNNNNNKALQETALQDRANLEDLQI